jgi:phenylacetic acid degradation operon negative regulatory protein
MPDHSPRHLILSLFGLYAREEPTWLSVRTLIALMVDLDVDAAATRSSVSRLKKRGVLESARAEGQAGYRLSATALAVLREGDARIWSRPRASVADGWLVVIFSVPEAERGKRHEARLRHRGSRRLDRARHGVRRDPGLSGPGRAHGVHRAVPR